MYWFESGRGILRIKYVCLIMFFKRSDEVTNILCSERFNIRIDISYLCSATEGKQETYFDN
jgi:hypothetical protein